MPIGKDLRLRSRKVIKLLNQVRFWLFTTLLYGDLCFKILTTKSRQLPHASLMYLEKQFQFRSLPELSSNLDADVDKSRKDFLMQKKRNVSAFIFRYLPAMVTTH